MLGAMRVLLITLHSKFVHASLALPLLAGFCRAPKRQLLIREYTVHEPKEAVLAAILAENPDVVALSVYIWNRRESLELADALAVAKPALRIVVGGPEVSFDGPDLFDRHPGLNALIRGEGELPLRALLTAWQEQRPPVNVPRLTWRSENRVVENPDGPTLASLDEIPSPFALDLVDLSRGLVYLETSRGCPFRCAFCMSALDPRVRSYSMARIEADLRLLMEREVPCIKLVDRTFNYDAERARHIFSFILRHHRRSRFHFEIGAQLLDDATLQLLEEAPAGLFQFEIGVQSTRADTLAAIRRSTDLEVLFENIRRLRRAENIPLHLDLIAGLPGENYHDFCLSIDRLLDLRPHHLQLEPVKLLPGSPLRQQAAQFGLRHDPHPPYTVLGTPELPFIDLERLRGMGRMLDLTWNAGRLGTFFQQLAELCQSPARALERLANYWDHRHLHRRSLSQRELFLQLWQFVLAGFDGDARLSLRSCLARDFALCERCPADQTPEFLEPASREEELTLSKIRIQEEMERIRGRGIKLQHLTLAFDHLPGTNRRSIRLYLYRSAPGRGLEVEEIPL